MEKIIPLTLKEINDDSQKRLSLISKEFAAGFEFVKNYPRSVTFFGSARTKESNEYYKKARRIAGRIVKELHYSVTTGGGPGIMEAANRGAFESGGNSLGLTIDLPREQLDNKYLTDREEFHYFFSRKVCLSYSAEAYLFFPGGFGTMDELLEILTLVQTKKIPAAPIILVGEKFWNDLKGFTEILIKEKFISKSDLNIFNITDNEDQILAIIKNAPVRIGVKYDEDSHRPQRSQKELEGHDPLSDLFKKARG